MGYCINHPEIETRYLCMKHNIYLCEDCLICRDPDLFCKFRSSCPIHFISKKGFSDPPEETLEKKLKTAGMGDYALKMSSGYSNIRLNDLC